MSKQEEAGLILKLYELRREEVLRKARDWYFSGFNPESVEDVHNVMFSQNSAYLRMVNTYWDMAAALVNHGAISQELFTDTNNEHMSIFAKLEPFLEGCRAAYGPGFLKNLEQLIDNIPNGRERTAKLRERIKTIGAERARRQAQAAAEPASEAVTA